MRLKPYPALLNGNAIAPDEFGFTAPAGSNEPDGIVFHCRGNPPRPRQCRVAIRRGDPEKGVHGWDGNREAPTITPSIGCENRAGCCWHGHIIAGDWTP